MTSQDRARMGAGSPPGGTSPADSWARTGNTGPHLCGALITENSGRMSPWCDFSFLSFW